MKDYCSLFPDTLGEKYIGDCCKIHDNMCGERGTYCFTKTILPFYQCLRIKLNIPLSLLITFGGSLLCLTKYPYLVYKKYMYRKNAK